MFLGDVVCSCFYSVVAKADAAGGTESFFVWYSYGCFLIFFLVELTTEIAVEGLVDWANEETFLTTFKYSFL